MLRKLARTGYQITAKVMREWIRRDREYLDRQLLFDRITGFVADCSIEGDYFEFGCSQGGSLIDMADSLRRTGRLSSTRFFIFDSFQGLPEPTGLDGGPVKRYARGQYSCDEDQYKRNVAKGGVDLRRVTCIPGWYSESLTDDLRRKLPTTKAAIVLIDCDLYESTVPVLDFLSHYIQTGTVIVFDDWFSYKGRLDLGEARAFSEWLVKHPELRATEFHRSGRTMMSFVMQALNR